MPYYRRAGKSRKPYRPRGKKRPSGKKSYVNGAKIMNDLNKSAYGTVAMRSTGIPKTLYTKMRYVQTKLWSTGAVAQFNAWRLNSIYDPDQTGVGNSVQMFAKYMAIYSRYTVLGCKVEVEGTVDSSTQASTFIGLTATPYSPSQTYNTIDDMASDANCIGYKLLPPSTAGNVKFRFKRYISIAKLTGDNPLASDEAHGTVTSNPNQPAYLRVYHGINNGVTNFTATWMVKLTYYVLLSERIDQNA